ncbi:EAL domain-containing protein (putative c-di-GMP-specific phosphodiesterase class I) [Mesorhizobium sangaii]|uniref:EAL domain-containing protein (Putative c-di-GMP-specific phosphodiesterase class I) n=1 Tax=Mesorhizobium sangaii TaxID=505389 RepID=A0A841PLT5_9HYPH|nr:EAL domain-containing protein (putative c-di-GMP-specific phosphodiesterase class I) [Mesorhizobium sangaii]
MAKAAGCNRFQGYFFGRPAPRDKLGQLRVVNAEPLALSA